MEWTVIELRWKQRESDTERELALISIDAKTSHQARVELEYRQRLDTGEFGEWVTVPFVALEEE